MKALLAVLLFVLNFVSVSQAQPQDGDVPQQTFKSDAKIENKFTKNYTIRIIGKREIPDGYFDTNGKTRILLTWHPGIYIKNSSGIELSFESIEWDDYLALKRVLSSASKACPVSVLIDGLTNKVIQFKPHCDYRQ